MAIGRAAKILWLACALTVLASASLFAGNYFQGVAPASVPWPGGIVPYRFDTNYTVTATESNVILAGLREWELAAKVKFVPYTNQASYVLLQFTNDGSGTGYFLSGSPTTNATMMLHGLARGLMCHEAGHLFGLQHEHQRNDRASYITVNYANVLGGTNGEIAFTIDTNSTSFGAYDFVSVMHYGPDTFTNGLGDSLDPLPAYQKFYHKLGNLALSIGDRAAVSNLYGAPLTPLTNVVTTTADGGFGSLRAAIYYANDHPGTTIKFNIPNGDPGHGNGVFTISLLGELPPLVSAGTIIDGTTQSGFTNHPVIVLDGAQVSPEAGDVSGLHFYGTNCTVRALAFGNFPYAGVQFFCPDATSNHLENCYLGLKPDGTNAAPDYYAGAIFEFGAHNNFIGGITSTQRNIISGNFDYGILINDTNSDANFILGNYLGLDASGSFAVPNGKSGVGIYYDQHNNVIGGTNSGAGNVISGNGEYGIYLEGVNNSGAVIQGNFIGTDCTGSYAVSNAVGGVAVFYGAHAVTIGGTNKSARNVISGNNVVGVYFLSPGGGNFVQGNYIGVNAAGTNALPNTNGIYLVIGTSGVLVGGATPGAGNVISGNKDYGIYISDPGTSNNVVQGNFIGTDFTGTNALGNGDAGIGIWTDAAGNLIGGAVTGAGNIISGNASYGIAIGYASGNVLQGNFIGTDFTGKKILAGVAQLNGIGVWGGSANNLFGGSGAGNLISGNNGYGIFLEDPGTTGNVVQGNLIGTDLTGTNALGNSYAGVALWNGASGNSIGDPGAGNTIAFSGWAGVDVFDPPTTNNPIRSNSIFSNSALGIDLVSTNDDYTGVTANDLGDSDSGPNDLQNFPVITNAFGSGGSTIVLGKLNSTAGRSFSVDVYRNFNPDPTGYGQGQFYFGTASVTTDGSGNASFALTNSAANYTGQFFSATATSTGGDTSEFSADVLATNQIATLASASFTGPLQWRTNGFVFSLALLTNFNYRIQTATNLASPVAWVDLTNFFAISPSLTFTDRLATNYRVRFYRVASP